MMQEKEVNYYCFDKCGKVLVGGLDGGDDVGPLFPCKVDDCPHEDKRTDFIMSFKDTDGSDIQVAIRKLKSLEETPNG